MTSSDQRGRRPDLDGTGLEVAVVCARWNEFITERLLDDAVTTLRKLGTREPVVVRVPGAFEIPVMAMEIALHSGVDALIALGAVIRGDTPHFDFVAGQCAAGLMRVQLDTLVPCVFGVLTTDDVEQAEARIDKGVEAAEVAVEMAMTMKELK